MQTCSSIGGPSRRRWPYNSFSAKSFAEAANLATDEETTGRITGVSEEIKSRIEGSSMEDEGEAYSDIGFFAFLTYTPQKYSAQVDRIFSTLIRELLDATNISLSWLTAFNIAMNLLARDFISKHEGSLIRLVDKFLELAYECVLRGSLTEYNRIDKLLEAALVTTKRLHQLGNLRLEFNERDGIYWRIREKCEKLIQTDTHLSFRVKACRLLDYLRVLEKIELQEQKVIRWLKQGLGTMYWVYVCSQSFHIPCGPDIQLVSQAIVATAKAWHVRIRRNRWMGWIEGDIVCPLRSVTANGIRFEDAWKKVEEHMSKSPVLPINMVSLRYVIIDELRRLATKVELSERDKVVKKLLKVARRCADINDWGSDKDVCLAALNALYSLRGRAEERDRIKARKHFPKKLELEIYDWMDEATYRSRLQLITDPEDISDSSLLYDIVTQLGWIIPDMENEFKRSLKDKYRGNMRCASQTFGLIPIRCSSHLVSPINGAQNASRAFPLSDLFGAAGASGQSSSVSQRVLIQANSSQSICLLGDNLAYEWAEGRIWPEIETLYYMRNIDIRDGQTLEDAISRCCYEDSTRLQNGDPLKAHVRHELGKPTTLVIIDIVDETGCQSNDAIIQATQGVIKHKLFIVAHPHSEASQMNWDLKVECCGLSRQERDTVIEEILGPAGDGFKERFAEPLTLRLLRCPLDLTILCNRWAWTANRANAGILWIDLAIGEAIFEERWKIFRGRHSSLEISAEASNQRLRDVAIYSVHGLLFRELGHVAKSEDGIPARLLDRRDVSEKHREYILTAGYLVYSEVEDEYHFPTDFMKDYFRGCGLALMIRSQNQ